MYSNRPNPLKPGGQISARQMNQLFQQIEGDQKAARVDGAGFPPGPMPLPSPQNCINVSGENIPPYACMQIVGVDENGLLKVDKPMRAPYEGGADATYLTRQICGLGYAFNGSSWINIDDVGHCSASFPVRVLYDDSCCEPEKPGERWGPTPNSWGVSFTGLDGWVSAGRFAGSTYEGPDHICPAPGDYVAEESTLWLVADGSKTWIEFYNHSGETIPAHAIMEVRTGWTGCEGDNFIAVRKPTVDMDTAKKTYLFNGPVPIVTKDFGLATRDFPAVVRPDTDISGYVIGTLCGPKSGSWGIAKVDNTSVNNHTGYVVVGTDDNRLMVEPAARTLTVTENRCASSTPSTIIDNIHRIEVAWPLTATLVSAGVVRITLACVPSECGAQPSGCGSGASSGSGLVSGGGDTDCFDRCNGTALPTLAVTITNKVGCLTGLPDSFTLTDTSICSNWTYDIDPDVTCGSCTLQTLVLNPRGMTLTFGTSGGGCGLLSSGWSPRSGSTCSPIFAIWDIDDGAGNSCTITAVE